MFKNDLKLKIEGCKNAADFWKIVKACNNSSNTCINKITAQDWKTYFSVLLNSTNDIDLQHKETVQT